MKLKVESVDSVKVIEISDKCKGYILITEKGNVEIEQIMQLIKDCPVPIYHLDVFNLKGIEFKQIKENNQ